MIGDGHSVPHEMGNTIGEYLILLALLAISLLPGTSGKGNMQLASLS
jgi:hypothetical protein